MIPLLLLALACGDRQDLSGALDPVPSDPREALAACASQPFEELATTCRVEAAARAAGQDLPEVARRACEAIDDPRWVEECHFRVGEEFGRRGQVARALSHCGQAGAYRRFCLTHAAWNVAPAPDLSPGRPEPVLQAEARWLEQAREALEGAPEAFTVEALAAVRARFWFNLYLGSGLADPASARAASADSGPAARQGFALEAVRLLAPRDEPVPDDLVEQVGATWSGARPAPSGPSLGPGHRHGRYHPPILTGAEVEAGVSRLPTYGGGRRLVAPDPADDLVVATLEALYFRPETPAEVFLPYLEHPSREVRWTAARMVRVTPSDAVDHQAVLERLAASDDPGLAAQGRDGLEQREWTRFTGEPGRGRPPR